MTPRQAKLAARPPLSALEQDYRYKSAVVEAQVIRGIKVSTVKKRRKEKI